MEDIKNLCFTSMKDRMRYTIVACCYLHESLGVKFFLNFKAQNDWKLEYRQLMKSYLPMQWIFNRISWNDTQEGRQYWVEINGRNDSWHHLRAVTIIPNYVGAGEQPFLYLGTNHELDFF